MVRVAVIGAGKMGLSHLAIASAHSDVELVAVCDSSQYLLDVLEKYGKYRTFADYKTLLQSVAVDAVIIATPSRSHGEIVAAALERGIHVFCEKPFCLDLELGKRLAEMAEAKRLVNLVGYHYRSIGTFREARRLLSHEILGRVHHVRAEAYGPVVLRARKGVTWRAAKVEGGGCLHDYASHAIDLLNYLVGPPVGVSGSVKNSIFSRDVDDEVYTTLLYRDGMTGQLAANWSDDSYRKMTMKVTVWGEKGRLVADRQELQIYHRGPDAEALGIAEGWTVKYTTELTEPVWYYLRGEEYSAQIDNFIGRILGHPAGDNEATFNSAIDTDWTVKEIARDAETEPAISNPKEAPAQRNRFLHALGIKNR